MKTRYFILFLLTSLSGFGQSAQLKGVVTSKGEPVPFANVLIDPAVPSDLYPRHFIHALRRPSAYFGAVELFGREALGGEVEDIDSGYDMIRTVDVAEFQGGLGNSCGGAGKSDHAGEYELFHLHFVFCWSLPRKLNQPQ